MHDKATFKLIVPLCIAFLLSACSGSILTTKDPAQRVLIYGHLDMSSAGNAAKYLVVKSNQQMKMAANNRFDYFRFPEDGYFTVVDLLPGYTYTIAGIRSSMLNGNMRTNAMYTFGEGSPKEYEVQPGPAEMVYVGAYRYVPHKRKESEVLGNSEEFTLSRVTTVTEADVLRRIRKEINDAHWKRRIDMRMRELGVKP